MALLTAVRTSRLLCDGVGYQSRSVIIKPFQFDKIAILSQFNSYSRSLVHNSLKILKKNSLKYGIFEPKTRYFKPAYYIA